MNSDFNKHFEFFGFDFNLAMSCVGPKGLATRKKLATTMMKNNPNTTYKEILNSITFHSVQFMRKIQDRKGFIANHPKKLEITKKIINARNGNKIITFSPNIKTAESIGGYVYTGKESSKGKNRITLEEFSNATSGVLNTVKMAEAGLSIPDVDVGIMLAVNSSKTKAIQTLGRTIRFKPGKQAEFFNIVIGDCVEIEWFKKSHSGQSYIIIDEEGLDDVLAGRNPKPYKKKIKEFVYRF